MGLTNSQGSLLDPRVEYPLLLNKIQIIHNTSDCQGLKRELLAQPTASSLQLLHLSRSAHSDLKKQHNLTWPFLCSWSSLSIFVYIKYKYKVYLNILNYIYLNVFIYKYKFENIIILLIFTINIYVNLNV